MTVLSGPDAGATHDLVRFASIGSHPLCEVRIPSDPGVSAFHVMVNSKDGRFFAKDLNSALGTVLDGRRLPCLAGSTVATVSAGDTLFCGSSELTVDLRRGVPGAAGSPSGSDSAAASSSAGGAARRHPGVRTSSGVAGSPGSTSSPYRGGTAGRPSTTGGGGPPGSSPGSPGPDPLTQAFVSFGREHVIPLLNHVNPAAGVAGRALHVSLLLLARHSAGATDPAVAGMVRGVLAEHLPAFGSRFPRTPLDVFSGAMAHAAVPGDSAAHGMSRALYEADVWRRRLAMVVEGCEATGANVDEFIVDRDARAFWRESFGEAQMSVPVAEFAAAFASRFEEHAAVLQEYDDELAAAAGFAGNGMITPPEFDMFIERYGPFAQCGLRFTDCLTQPWFHVNLFTERGAADLLVATPPGTFVVRPAEGNQRHLRLSYRPAFGSGVHSLPIENAGADGFRLLTPGRVRAVPLGVRPPEPEWVAGPAFRRVSDLVAANHHLANTPLPPSAVDANGGGHRRSAESSAGRSGHGRSHSHSRSRRDRDRRGREGSSGRHAPHGSRSRGGYYGGSRRLSDSSYS
jgi:pSer/pThr/pTyr-binding forkhead associated (FHA) protein